MTMSEELLCLIMNLLNIEVAKYTCVIGTRVGEAKGTVIFLINTYSVLTCVGNNYSLHDSGLS